MKIARFLSYGTYKNIYIDDVKIPVIEDDDVLVEVCSASINMLDVRVVTGEPEQIKEFLGKPDPIHNFLGSDIAGVVVKVGANVTDFKVGDEVFGQLSIMQDGGFAEYAKIPAKQVFHKPSNISFSEAASVPMAGITALQALRNLGVNENKRILIYGASGGVGTFAIQIAKALGAHVTAVCSTRNYKNAVAFNADKVIDYKKENWFNSNMKYDMILNVNGYNSLDKYLDSLNDNGKILYVALTPKLDEEKEILKTEIENRGIELLNIYAKINQEDYKILAKMLEEKQLIPFIDKEYPLEKIQKAYKHFMNGKTIGKTVITVK